MIANGYRVSFYGDENVVGPGQVAQLVRASPRYANIMGSISGQDTKKQPMNAQISGITNRWGFFLPFKSFF